MQALEGLVSDLRILGAGIHPGPRAACGHVGGAAGTQQLGRPFAPDAPGKLHGPLQAIHGTPAGRRRGGPCAAG
jgi:hypothetical protein